MKKPRACAGGRKQKGHFCERSRRPVGADGTIIGPVPDATLTR